MIEFAVDEARLDDVPCMANLLEILFAQEHEFQPNTAAQKTALTTLLEESHLGRLFVARVHGSVVGMVSLLFTVSTARGGRAAWLEDLVVLPAARGQGVGTRLIEHALRWARCHDVRRITLLTDPDNTQAQALYLRQGFTLSRMVPLRLQLY